MDAAQGDGCGLSGAARHLWRGRHGAAPAGGAGRALHGLRSRSQPHRVRQVADQAALRGGGGSDGALPADRLARGELADGLEAAGGAQTRAPGLQRRAAVRRARLGLGQALAEAMRYDSQVLMEEKIVGRECTVGILGDEPLPLVEVRPKTGIYDYQNKYTAGATEYFCPAPFDAATTARIQAAGLGAFQAIGGRDYSRVDVIVRPNGEPVVLEVNTLPGMTETSLLPKAAAAAGMGYAELCQRMVDLALKRKHVVQA